MISKDGERESVERETGNLLLAEERGLFEGNKTKQDRQGKRGMLANFASGPYASRTPLLQCHSALRLHDMMRWPSRILHSRLLSHASNISKAREQPSVLLDVVSLIFLNFKSFRIFFEILNSYRSKR